MLRLLGECDGSVHRSPVSSISPYPLRPPEFDRSWCEHTRVEIYGMNVRFLRQIGNQGKNEKSPEMALMRAKLRPHEYPCPHSYPPCLSVLQATDVSYKGKYFHDFGFGNETSYYDVTLDESFLDDLVDDEEYVGIPTLHGQRVYHQEQLAKRKAEGGEYRNPLDDRGRGRFNTRDNANRDSDCYDEGSADYDQVYSEDVFLGRATRVRAAVTRVMLRQ